MTEEQISLLWKGPFFSNNSLAKINHSIYKHLLEYDDFNLHISPAEQIQSAWQHQKSPNSMTQTDYDAFHTHVTVNSQWPPSFEETVSKHLVCVQPWDFNTMPKNWYSLLKDKVNEVWAYSKYTKEFCIHSEIPENKIKVIPLGVDETIYHSDVKPFKLENNSSFRFLFIFRPSEHETLDALIKAFKQEFSADDDISLIVKKIDADIINRGISNDKSIIDEAADPSNPNVLFLNQHLSEQEMAGLFKSCDCLVYPHIGDGFVLPIIESMACGTPAIIPNFGAAQEFCDKDTSFIFNLKEETLNQIEMTNTDNPWWLKIDSSELQKIMRFVYENQAEVKKRGKKASEKILSTATWKQTANAIVNNVKELVQKNQVTQVTSKKDFYSQLFYGIEFYKSNRFEDALKLFLSILSDHPDSLEVHYNTAIVYMKKKDYNLAIEHLLYITRTMENEPKDFKLNIWNFLGICYSQIDSIPEAINAFKKALTINPLLRSKVLIFLKKILHNTSSPSSELYHELGDCYFQLGNVFHAEEMYMKALKYGDNQIAILESLAKVYESINNIKKQTMENYSKYPISTPHLNQSITWLQLDSYPLDDTEEIICERRKRWKPYFTNGNQILEIQWCFNNILTIKMNERTYDGILILVRENSLTAYQFLSMFKSSLKWVNPTGKIIIILENSNTTSFLSIFNNNLEKILNSLGWTIKETSDTNDTKSFYIILQKTSFDILWKSLLLNSSGYAQEQSHFLDAIRPYPLRIKVNTYPFDKPETMENLSTHILSLQNQQMKSPLIHYQAAPVTFFSHPIAPISIGRTMFETNSIPKSWVEILNEMTEIWVPSEFNRETFASAGVNLERIKIIPGTLDDNKYNPKIANPYSLARKDTFKFLSVFDWSIRKGWDVLLQAYFEEFSEEDDVSLILKVATINEPNTNPYMKISNFAKKMGLKKLPHIQIIQETLTEEEMIGLYAATDCFVLPSRGEGWGRPYMEAMAMELPTIGTKWSGQQAFMNDDNSYLININGLTPIDPNSMPETFQGHQWADPSVDHLKVLMRHVYNNPEEAKQKGLKARKYLFPRFSKQTIGQEIFKRIDELVNEHFK